MAQHTHRTLRGCSATFAQRTLAVTLAIQVAAATPVRANEPPDLASTPIEDLMNIEISSASRIQQRRADVPAAVYVITAEAIRQSGVTLLPELLRGVPGIQVARINSNQWAVSARGFDDIWSGKLLVLIDGRSVYSRTFSGVDWNALDLPLDEIERIEVIRGADGSVWGANAVNAVVNIITKSAADTQGVAVGIDAGSFDRDRVGIRYGGRSGNAAYRVYSQWSDHGASRAAAGASAGDSWQRLSAGARVDWSRGADGVTAEATLVTGHQWPLWASFAGPTPSLSFASPTVADSTTNPNAMLHWTHGFADGTSLEVRTFFDFTQRHLGNGTEQNERVGDVEAQIERRFGQRHHVAIGGGFRDALVHASGTLGYTLAPADIDLDTVSVFAQDDIALAKRLHLSLGSRFENDAVVGNAFEPSIRATWQVSSRYRIWGALTRAAHNPSASDLYARFNYAVAQGPGGVPILVGFVGNADLRPDTVTNAEAGVRFDLHSMLSVDVNAYRAVYDRLTTAEPLAPTVETVPQPAHLFAGYQFQNLLNATTSGIEIAAHWVPVRSEQVDVSYTGFLLTPDLNPASRDLTKPAFDGNAPADQWMVRSSTAIGARLEFSGAVFHAGRLQQMNVAGYTRVDARLALALSDRWTLALTSQNLLDDAHQEFAPNGLVLQATDVPRSIGIHVDWRMK